MGLAVLEVAWQQGSGYPKIDRKNLVQPLLLASSGPTRSVIRSTLPRFLPEHTTAVSLLDRLLHHASVVVTDGDSYRMREARARKGTTLNKT